MTVGSRGGVGVDGVGLTDGWIGDHTRIRVRPKEEGLGGDVPKSETLGQHSQNGKEGLVVCKHRSYFN